jgi:hypothetical protein
VERITPASSAPAGSTMLKSQFHPIDVSADLLHGAGLGNK